MIRMILLLLHNDFNDYLITSCNHYLIWESRDKYRQSPVKNQPINHKVDNIKVLCDNYYDHANKLKLRQWVYTLGGPPFHGPPSCETPRQPTIYIRCLIDILVLSGTSFRSSQLLPIHPYIVYIIDIIFGLMVFIYSVIWFRSSVPASDV